MADQTSSGSAAAAATVSETIAKPLLNMIEIAEVLPPVPAEAIFAPFDSTPVRNALQHLQESPRPAVRLHGIWKTYTEVLVRRWGDFVEQVWKASEAFESRLAAEIAAKRSEHDSRCASADAAFEHQNRPLSTRREAAMGAAHRFIAESNSEMAAIWNRLGLGLDIARPDPLSAESMAGRTPAHAQGYRTMLEQARALPRFEQIHDEPTIRSHLWKFGAGGMFLGLVFFGTFLGSVITGALVAGAVIGIRMLIRGQARETFRQFVEAAQGAQALAWQQALGEAGQCDRQSAVLIEQRDKLKAKARAVLDDSLSDISDAFERRRRVATEMWEASVHECTNVVDAIQSRLSGLIAEHSATLGPLAPEHRRESPLERLRLRVGEIEPPPLPRLRQECVRVVGYAAPKPLSLRFPALWDGQATGALLTVDSKPAREGSGDFVAAVIARALALIPPGKVNFTLFDPVGLGHNFGGFLKLGDYAKDLIGGQAWSAREHMRSRLRDLISHIETVTQKYLRNDFPDIESYNEKAGEIAEPYRILAIADFPEQFDEEMARDLERIVQNGPRCGVFTLLHVNSAAKAAHGVSAESLKPFASVVRWDEAGGPMFQSRVLGEKAWPFGADRSPADPILQSIVTRHGEGSKDAMRVEFSYERLLERAKLRDEPWWGRSASGGIEVPIGPLGAQKVQNFTLGSGLAHHALIVGRPGSGKSNLLHVFISTVCRLYSPDEVQLYLIDFKKGVEFKDYAEAGLPHARVIAVESEREFGLSVLNGLDAELHSRGESFRQAKVTSIREFREKTGKPLPRIVLIVDEFQEFFTRDDKIHREARVLFDRLVRQGRAFGVHVILGTQSLANAGVPQSTRDQMAVRIALQCSDADSRLILGDNNSAARLLTRPGEAIYNEQAGEIEGNNLFQVAIFSEKDRQNELRRCAAAARERGWRGPPPVVFEGHEPAQLGACRLLADAGPMPAGARLDMWIGEPIALKPAVAATLKRQAGRNLLILHKDEQQGIGVAMSALLSLAAQSKAEDMSFSILDFAAADAEWADHCEAFAGAIPHEVVVGGKRDVRSEIARHREEIARRIEAEPAAGSPRLPTLILAIVGLHRIRELRAGEPAGISMSLDRNESESALSEQLIYILREGPEVGVHVIVWSDGYASLERVIDRRDLEEFGLRVSGALSGEESHRLYDSDAAALLDKPFRMLKSDEEQVGVVEAFRPYALVSPEFMRAFGERRRSRPKGVGHD